MGHLNIDIPHLAKNGQSSQLIVNGRPFLIRGGELQNSSLTSVEYMEPVWQKMKDTNINTLLGCVTWEMIEPEENSFDFSILDDIILAARKHSMHLVLLWFGSFKNGKYVVPIVMHHEMELLTITQDFQPTPLHGSSETQSASPEPSCGRLAAGSRQPMFYPFSTKRAAKPTRRLLGPS